MIAERVRVTTDEYQVAVGDFVRMPVENTNTGWRIVRAVRDEYASMGVTGPAVALEKRRCYPWKPLFG